MIRKLALTTVFLFAASVASAAGIGKGGCRWEEVNVTFWGHSFERPKWECSKTPPAIAAPEMDPTSAIAAFVLMFGSLAVLRGRRAKTPKA